MSVYIGEGEFAEPTDLTDKELAAAHQVLTELATTDTEGPRWYYQSMLVDVQDELWAREKEKVRD